MKVLIVEDDQEILEMLESFFQDHFTTIFTSKTVSGAIEILKTTHVDFISSDYQLEDQNCFNILKYVDEFQPTTPVFIYSGHDSSEIKRKLTFQCIRKISQKPDPKLLKNLTTEILSLKKRAS